MICLLHGYLLEGSGSNLWTRSILQSLCRKGETVHLVCQENHPDLYDFISKVFIYKSNGDIEVLFDREIDYPGKCIMHKPILGETLPVYVWDRYEEFSNVQPMIDLNNNQIEDYLEKNIKALEIIIKQNPINVFHANHAVLMSVVANRLNQKFGIPFTIMPHGSAIEYAVKKDKRFFDFASEAFDRADRIFVIGDEIRNRVKNLFPEIKNINQKMTDLNLGVDTSLFEPIPNKQRAKNIQQLIHSLEDVPRGKNPHLFKKLITGLNDNINKNDLISLITDSQEYNAKHTDGSVEQRFANIDLENDQIILFVGRLIASKGIQSIFAALPFIFEKYPTAKFVVVGHGPLREALEALTWAYDNRADDLVKNIVEWGRMLEDSGIKPLIEVQQYFKYLENNNLIERYFETASKVIREDKIIFTGYLTHKELRYLFPICDVALFP